MIIFQKIRFAIEQILNGDLRILGGPAIDPSIGGRVRAEQIDAIVRSTPRMMLGNVLTGSVLVIGLCWTSDWLLGLAWGACLCGLTGYGYLRWRQKQARPKPASASQRAIRIVALNAALLAGVWAFAPMLFLAHSAEIRLVVSCLVAGMMSGGFALATVPAAMIAFELIFVAGSLVGLARHGEMIDLAVAGLLIVYAYVVIRTAIAHAILFAEHVVSRIEGERQRDVIGLLLREFETNASDWLWELDEEFRIRHVSARLSTMLGRISEELVGQSWRLAITPGGSLLPHAARGAHAELARQMLDRGSFRDHVVMVHVQDETRWWSITGKPIIDAAGVFQGYRGFGSDITATRRAEERIEHMARFDALTGLPNRRSFLEQVGSSLARLQGSGQSFAVVSIDVDRFKQVNELFGRRNGDDVMKEIAERLSTCLRDGDVFGRIDGDQFGVIRVGVTSADELVFLSKRFNESMRPPFVINGLVAECSISIGIAIAAKETPDADALLHSADLAMENAKRIGPGSHRFFDADIDLNARESARFESELRDAIQKREMEIVWLPVVGAQSREIVACHARLRWRHAEKGALWEEEFLPAAERSGLAGLIGVWKLRKVCAQAAKLPGVSRVSVNLSRMELEDPGMVLMLARTVESSRLAADRVEIRLAEQLVRSASDAHISAIRAIGQFGARIAIVAAQGVPIDLKLPCGDAPASIVFDASPRFGNLEGCGASTESGVDLVACEVADEAGLSEAIAAGCCFAEGPLFGPELDFASLVRELSPATLGDQRAVA